MYVGVLSLDLLLGDVHSLKEKRSLVRPIVAELRKRYDVAAAEAGHVEMHRRSLSGRSRGDRQGPLRRGARRLREAGGVPPGSRAALGTSAVRE